MGIPLVALSVKPPESITQQFGQAMQLKSLVGQQQIQQEQLKGIQQENQMRQQEIEDNNKLRQAYIASSGDSDKVIQTVSQAGVGPKALAAAYQLKASQIDMKTKFATMQKDELANVQMQANLVASTSQAILNLPAEQRRPALQQALTGLSQKGVIQPQQAQAMLQNYGQMSDSQLEEDLRVHALSSMSAKDQAEQALKAREVTAQEEAAHARTLQASKPPAEQVELEGYTKDFLAAKGLENTPQNRMAARLQYFKDKQPFGAQKLQILQEGQNLKEQQASKKDTDFIDKTYVKPANDVEKSYQMFMDAYNNRNNAKTGAESMLALSTHLATTFGNVKGARVTKDMIEHHLGARGITDSMQVAVQKLTNGDVLSPDQWDAFKQLISNSRKLTWAGAKKEADRRGVDISESLPDDIKNPSTAAPASTGMIFARDPQGKLHSAPAGTKLPAGWSQEKQP